jgi:hypothetical protein
MVDRKEQLCHQKVQKLFNIGTSNAMLGIRSWELRSLDQLNDVDDELHDFGRCRRMDNIKIDLVQIGYGGVDWMGMA